MVPEDRAANPPSAELASECRLVGPDMVFAQISSRCKWALTRDVCRPHQDGSNPIGLDHEPDGFRRSAAKPRARSAKSSCSSDRESRRAI